MTTNSCKEIGGYFGLEIEQKYDNISDSIALNCARNCLRYVIKAFDIKEIYIPYYTCPVVWQSIQQENCRVKCYHIDKSFFPTADFPKNAYILYTNYFGICAKNVKILADRYNNLIVDNAQAFYMPKYGIASFNSVRKFFGVPDGALLHTDKKAAIDIDWDISYDRCSHMLKRADKNAKFGYSDFQKNEDMFEKMPIKYMSNLSRSIFNAIDIKKVKEKRLENFNFLHKQLADKNELNISLDEDDVPMVYPYLIQKDSLREKLIKNNIYVATYWNPLSTDSEESIFQKYLLPLPIDQRYGKQDMKMILELL